MPRPSSRKAKVPLGKPECSFEEGSTTDGCKHGTLVRSPKRKSFMTQEEAAMAEGNG